MSGEHKAEAGLKAGDSEVRAVAPRPANETRILILAPTGSDARNTTDFLVRSGLQPKACRDVSDLYHHVAEGCLHDDKTYEGTGIGLAIVKRAVTRMNGQVGVESQAGSQAVSFWCR